jgi:hypothetical protein
MILMMMMRAYSWTRGWASSSVAEVCVEARSMEPGGTKAIGGGGMAMALSIAASSNCSWLWWGGLGNALTVEQIGGSNSTV